MEWKLIEPKQRASGMWYLEWVKTPVDCWILNLINSNRRVKTHYSSLVHDSQLTA